MDAQSRVAAVGRSGAPRASIARVVLLAAVLLVLALLACWWQAVELYAPHEDLWVRLLRGGLSRITVPVLLLGSAAALAALLIGVGQLPRPPPSWRCSARTSRSRRSSAACRRSFPVGPARS